MLYPPAWEAYPLASKAWTTVEFAASRATAVPDTAGVYAFLVQPRIDARLDASYLFYVGESVSLKDRFRSYLREERGHEHARQQLYSLFRDFPGRVFFTFAAVSATKRKATEDALLEALTPPLNTRLPATIARAERAF